MDYPELITLDLDGIAQGGDAVGRLHGLVYFVRGGLPGERVRARVLERRQSFARAEALEVLGPSPDRLRRPGQEPGNASWGFIDYPAQLRLKEQIVAEQLAKLAGLSDPPIGPILAAPRPWGYRNSARLQIAAGLVGYHVPGSRDLEPTDHDPLLMPALNEALAELAALADRMDPPAAELTLRASVAHGYVVAALEPYDDAGPAEQELLADLAAAWRAAVPGLAAVELPGGERARLHDELGGVSFSLGVHSFFQVNLDQAARMLDLLRERLALDPESQLLDAYSGAGTFALPLARQVARVIAVEEFPGAVADGALSAELNGIANVNFERGPVERVLPRLEGPFGAAVLDPPRRGCHPAALAALVALAPPQIAYISCHPGILGRDLRPLLDGGYRISLVQPIDLFPQTPHIETVVFLERG